MVCWLWQFDWNFAHVIAPVVTANSVILSSRTVSNGVILVCLTPISQRRRVTVCWAKFSDWWQRSLFGSILASVCLWCEDAVKWRASCKIYRPLVIQLFIIFYWPGIRKYNYILLILFSQPYFPHITSMVGWVIPLSSKEEGDFRCWAKPVFANT